MEAIWVEFLNLALLFLLIVPGAHFDNITSLADGNETTLPNPLVACGNTQCRLELDEVCSSKSLTCECPDNKDRRNESDRCTEYKEMIFPLLLARQQPTGPLLYNNSYNDKNSLTYTNFAGQFESGMTNVFQHSKFFPFFLRLSVDKVIRPIDMNVSLGEGGLWVEFSLRLVSVVDVNDEEIYKELVHLIDTQFSHSLGGLSLVADKYQMPTQCFTSNCPRDGLCLVVENRPKCQCQVGCRDLDPAKAGRVCSCPCTSRDSNTCPEFSDCIPFDNRDGYTCKCKIGFIDDSSSADHDQNNRSNGINVRPRCVMNYCIQKQADCQKKNATCIIRDGEPECQCLDGFMDVRKSGAKNDVETICLRPIDVDECILKIHNCHPPSTCTKWNLLGYQCICPDNSSVLPDMACSMQSRAGCALCNHHGTCSPSSDNRTTICECDEGYSGDDCSLKLRTAKSAQMLHIGGMEIEWSWIAFGVGAGLGIFICVLLFTLVKVIQRQCRKKPTVRPSVDDEVFNFHEVTRNVYGVGAIENGKKSERESRKLNGPFRSSFTDSPAQFSTSESPCPYAVSEVSVSTFKRNGTHT